VVVLDDIQWGEETFLDLIEHVALLSSDAPILLFCIARQELIQRRPTWPVTLPLEPLGDEDVAELIPKRIPGELREKITRAAGGNPLFIEEIVAIAGDGGGDVVVPPTLQALLAARLDRLETAERSVLERGAIEGEIFHRGAVQALAPETKVTPYLAALVRKGLIRPDRPQLEREDGFRFRHILIRDAAYAALSKASRAELHERFATWLGEHGTELAELDEILGYHLEQACTYRAELGMSPDDELTEAARRRLSTAGRRAHLRADYGAAVSLLERAAALAPPDDVDLALETDLVDALFWGDQASDALRRSESISERASAVGDEVGKLCGQLQTEIIRAHLEPEGGATRLAALVDLALPVFQASSHDVGLCIAYHAVGESRFDRAKTDAAFEAYERAAAHARRAGLTQEFLDWRAACCMYGTTSVPDVIAWLDEQLTRAGLDHWLRTFRALAMGMLGRFDEGRTLLAEVRKELSERGGGIRLAVTTGIESVSFELLAGDPATAAELGADGCGMLEELGDHSFLSSALGNLAQALYALGRLDEADVCAERSAEFGSSEDAFTQLIWRQVRAKVLARRSERIESERIAREAVTISEGTDFLNGQGDAQADLAEVLLLLGEHDEAGRALGEALDRYERKGNVVMSGRIRDRLATVAPTT
jgi:tetratricopeptide (TPR) repeat protein